MTGIAVALIGLSTGWAHGAAQAACAGAESDFNGDGARDTVISDPDAVVSGHAEAGSVTVVYGNDAGTAQIHQDVSWVADTAEADDRFGYSTAVTDVDSDGCSDLLVGVPYEDVGAVRDAGLVQLFYGSPTGFGAKAGVEFAQGQKLGGVAQAGDLSGYALAAGKSTTGIPFLVIGAPGEDVAGIDAGMFFYVHGAGFATVPVTEDSPGVWAVSDPHDRLGASIAATSGYIAVGAPGEAVGRLAFSGGVLVFRPSINTNGIPDPVFGFGQNTAADSGDAGAEAYDRFGTSVALTDTRAATENGPRGAVLAVGVPGEDIGTVTDAGAVGLFRINPDKTLTHIHDVVHQNLPDVDGEATAGDFFGQQVALVNTAPAVVATGETVKLAVGVPGKETSPEAEQLDKGGVQVFPVQSVLGTADAWLDPGYGIPGVPEHQMFAGTSLGATPQELLVGVVNPSGAVPGAVYAFNWSVASGGAPTRSLIPGEGGIPAGGVSFGAVVR
ncbi:FG-GAP repeat protein [Streptomyces sp. NPDC050504]|uniref:FG-GAP repeat protein n=1 Tax=Streptomyces sp. NPDC050504 TaxID=3365618 RepID=UPI00378A9B42